MGTSSSQRSPATPEWERVRELYLQPNPNPAQVLARIVAALDSDTRAGMSDPGVACCLGHLLDGATVAATGELSALYPSDADLAHAPVIGLASGLRQAAEQDIVVGQLASRFSDLALDALGTSVLDIAESIPGGGGILRLDYAHLTDHMASYYHQNRLHDLTQTFLAHDLDHVFRHFVARDISDFVGTEALPTVTTSSVLQDRIAHTCRIITAGVDLSGTEAPLRDAIAQHSAEHRTHALQDVFRYTLDSGLAALADAEVA
jgi:hypothetical protein